ncbi:WD40/YVTN/BNR-like repeat-containing protein [Flavobacterium suncheonense]|uniref:Oxidoreductase n=1 Tax=Flavobacterium suncheonense GH29-5 = DSM 17707 TaxID=1121899 RepID=A0A0A2MR67_9FLAO|nr:oxidoreductase [Flavobacterium suncheonense]KGO90725.1 oxidoreductase [Flavobacterium suncheonense GH29-5 = DSM 17707]
MRSVVVLLCAFLCFSCNLKSFMGKSDTSVASDVQPTPLLAPSFTEVVIDTLLSEKLSIRALTIDNDKVWYAANNGNYGCISLKDNKRFVGNIQRDTLKLEFRSMAQTKDNIFVLSIANPGLLYRISKDGKETQLVYEEKGEKVFYDAISFWNDKEGMAVGDPTDDCFSLLITRDGGETWTKISCDNLPKLAEGEAFFAASNTNIIIKGEKTWVVSGGKKSRVFYSEDKGKSWQAIETPIVQGSAMTGMFSADFYDETLGFATGGDYEKPQQNFGNKIITHDGGKTWNKVGENEGYGYGSCVQFVPGSNGNELLTVGASGVYYSYDQGKTWRKIADYKDLFTIRFVDAKTAIAAGNKKILRLKFK